MYTKGYWTAKKKKNDLVVRNGGPISGNWLPKTDYSKSFHQMKRHARSKRKQYEKNGFTNRITDLEANFGSPFVEFIRRRWDLPLLLISTDHKFSCLGEINSRKQGKKNMQAANEGFQRSHLADCKSENYWGKGKSRVLGLHICCLYIVLLQVIWLGSGIFMEGPTMSGLVWLFPWI